jgi:hypothetical protein
MWRRLLNGLRAVEEAERTAEALRSKYGVEAESWCEAMMAALPPTDRRRDAIADIRRALRWIPSTAGQEVQA